MSRRANAGSAGASGASVKRRKRLTVTLKAAITLDGHTAARSGDSKWITSLPARRAAHRLRAQSDAVLVGVGTVLRDDPELTVRHVRGKNPLRVVLDSRLRTPRSSRVAQVGPERRTLIAHGPKAPLARRRALAAAGVQLIELPVGRDRRPALPALLRALQKAGIARLLLEGGPTVHGAFLDAGLVDRLWLAIAPMLLGDGKARPLADGRLRARIADALPVRLSRVSRLGPDLLIEGSLRRPRARPGRTG